MTLHNIPTASTTHPLASSIIRAVIASQLEAEAWRSTRGDKSSFVTEAVDSLENMKAQFRAAGITDEMVPALADLLASWEGSL